MVLRVLPLLLVVGCTPAADLSEYGRGSAAAMLAYVETLPPVAEAIGIPRQPPPDRFGNLARAVSEWASGLDADRHPELQQLWSAYYLASLDYDKFGPDAVNKRIRAVKCSREVRDWLTEIMSERWQTYGGSVRDLYRCLALGLENYAGTARTE